MSGVADGDFAFVERLVPGAPAQRAPQTQSAGGPTSVQAPALPADGEHVLRVVVRDVNGHLSTDDLPGSPADRAPSQVTHLLDTAAGPGRAPGLAGWSA